MFYGHKIVSAKFFAAAVLGAAATSTPVHAQTSTPVVSVCTGLSLPRSAVTDLLSPVITGVAQPVEDRVNAILDIVEIIPLVGTLIPDLDTNVSGLLAGAAAGDPLSLQILDTQGNVVDPADGCDVQGSSLSLADAAGIAIGGNRITGLGADGAAAFAGDIDAIAFGNGARSEVGATASVAIGRDAAVDVANSVAIGAGSSATRGPQLAYAALALDGTQFSAGEFAIGAAGAERQITHVAPGSAPTDAVNVAQLQSVVDDVAAQGVRISALEADGGGGGAGTPAPGPVRYADADSPTTPNDGTPTDEATLAGAGSGPVGLHNVRDGALAAGSTDAVNGGQLYATNQQVAANTDAIAQNTGDIARNTTAITENRMRIQVLENSVTGSTVSPIQYSDAATPTVSNGGTITNDVALIGADSGPVALHNVAAGVSATDAVNVGQLNAGLQGAVAEAQAYTDVRFDLLARDMGRVRRDAEAGTAGALAAAALPQASDPGRGMVAMGLGTYQGEGALALGLSTRLEGGQTVIRAGATVDTRGRAGANAGVGIQF